MRTALGLALAMAVAVRQAAADADRAPRWTRVTQLARCRVQLEPASQAERDDLQAMARERLLAAVDVTTTALGDRIERIDGRKLAPPTKPPRTETDAKRIASEFLARTADLFGIAYELSHVDLVPRRNGRGWLAQAVVRRTVVATQSFETSASIEIELDRDGRVAVASVGPGLLPQFAICDGPRLRKDNPKLLAHVLGATPAGRPIVRDDVVGFDAGVIRLGELELAVGYTITVSTAHGRFRFNVDGDTGDVWSIEAPAIGTP
jgi:hypothetical protein